MGRPGNFKQFKKREKVKAKSSMKRKISKAAGLGKRRSNRHDADDSHQSRATLEELVGKVNSGSVTASLDPLDPRALTDMLLKKPGQPTAAAAARDKKTKEAKQKVAAEAEEQDFEEEDDEEVSVDTAEFEMGDDAVDPSSDRPTLVRSLEGIEGLPKSFAFDHIDVEDDLQEDGLEYQTKNRYDKKGEPYAFWKEHGVHNKIIRSLEGLKFTHPTPIQEEALPTALGFPLLKDVVVSSETGSGKTLVFALPIIQSILQGYNSLLNPVGVRPGKKKGIKRNRHGTDEGKEVPFADPNEGIPEILHSLVISPTRELAQQIAKSFESLSTQLKKNSVRVGCIVGGMAQHKQQRVLNKHPNVLICTPGRVWDLLGKNEGCFLGHSLSRRLSFVVLDEADRLLQSGRFEQLKKLLDRIHNEMLPAGRSVLDTGVVEDDGDVVGGPVEFNEETGEFEPIKAPQREGEEEAEDDAPTAKDRPRPMKMPPAPHKGHRVVTIITSATLSLDTNYEKKDIKGKRTILRTENASTLNKVVAACIPSQQYFKFEQKPETGVVGNLHETYLRCPDKSKELYLYYFLRKYRERTVIFVNAISMLRRLTKLIDILGIPCSSLHASMQQRQRLAYIDKFKSGERRVLIATDVAARGLDVEGVKYVVHYQLPRSTDAYIHRCGRTARCGGTGFSMAMVDSKEYSAFRKLMDSMNRTKPMEVFALEPVVIHHLVPHMQVAQQIDKLILEVSKQSAQQRWVKSNAEDVDIEADDMIKDDFDSEAREKMKAVKVLKKRLAAMTRRDIGHKGSFRSAPKALGANEAAKRMQMRADRQVYKK